MPTEPARHDFDCPTPDHTARLARDLSARLRPGCVILLSGPIGAGKTHFARALILSRLDRAGIVDEVPSPTFTLVQTYDDGAAGLVHADLYRLTGQADVHELGLADAFDDAIVLVEWPDRLGPETPADALTLDIAPSGDGRVIRASWSDPKWSTILGTTGSPPDAG